MPSIKTKSYQIGERVLKSKVVDIQGLKVTVYAKNGFLATTKDFINAIKKQIK